MPCAARDKANRISLAGYVKSCEENPSLPHAADAKKLLAAIGPSAATSNTFLLGWAPWEGQGHAITSYGNPDTATNTSTLVGGMSTGLGDLPRYMDDSYRMWQQAGLYGAKQPAAITWWGYDAPPGLAQSADSTRADAGAPALDAFQTGLRVTHHGERSLNTVVGHSYGSVLVGDAASHGRTLDADQIIFLGSPGVTVDHAWDLHLTGVPADQTSKHVFDSRAKYDIIQAVPPVKKYGWVGSLAAFAFLPPGLDYVDGKKLAHLDAKAQTLGADPWEPKFGDQRFASDPGKPMQDPALPYVLPFKLVFPGMPLPPRVLPSVDAHVGYWSTNNKALRNIGSIIAGGGVVYAP